MITSAALPCTAFSGASISTSRLRDVPFYLQPILIWVMTVFFFFFAAPARRAIVSNLADRPARLVADS